MSNVEPHSVPLPSESRITRMYRRPDLADAYAIDLPQGTIRNPELLARFIFSHQPRWVAALVAIRDSAVAVFGIKTGRSLRSAGEQPQRIGIFKLYEAGPLEVVVGEDDRHLNFRASVLYRPAGDPAAESTLVLSTVVHCHNLLGRNYLRVIAPFHRLVVQSFLRRAARIGWPREDAAASLRNARVGV